MVVARVIAEAERPRKTLEAIRVKIRELAENVHKEVPARNMTKFLKTLKTVDDGS